MCSTRNRTCASDSSQKQEITEETEFSRHHFAAFVTSVQKMYQSPKTAVGHADHRPEPMPPFNKKKRPVENNRAFFGVETNFRVN